MSQINCPTCGAKTDSVISNCEYCGIEIAKAQELTPQEYMKALAACIETAKSHAKKTESTFDEEKVEAEVIKNVPIPSDVGVS